MRASTRQRTCKRIRDNILTTNRLAFTAVLDFGFLAELSDRDSKTLCFIALPIDVEGPILSALFLYIALEQSMILAFQ